MKNLAVFAFTLFLLVGFPVSAQSSSETNVKIVNATFPVTFLGEVMADSHIDQDGFALQVSKTLQQHTRKDGSKACAMICKAVDGAWGASPLTISAHTACPVAPVCPKGFQSTGVGIHSHSFEQTYIAN